MTMKMPMEKSEEEEEAFNLFADEEEAKWRKAMPRYTEKELVEIYSPSKEMIAEKIRDWERRRNVLLGEMKADIQRVCRVSADEFSRWFSHKIIQMRSMPEFEKCNQRIFHLKRIAGILNPKKYKWENRNGELVENARRYPIYEIAKYRLLLHGSGRRYSALCPFHEEKHSSFCIYPETNTFHCFACQAHGDVIALTMHLYGVSFPEAVKMLQ